MVEAAATASVYAFMASWFTPSYLFIFINIVIGTIAITSRFTTTPRVQHQQHDSPQLVRSPSLLHRLMSFNLACYKYEPPTTLAETETQTLSVNEDPVLHEHDPTRMPRAPSLLDRVKSFNLGLRKQETPCPNPDDPTQHRLTRAPSLLERLMSVKLSRSESIKSEKKEPEPEPNITDTGNDSGHGNLGGGEEEGVDEKADDFIKRFKKQLRLQRLDSILRYRDMLKGN